MMDELPSGKHCCRHRRTVRCCRARRGHEEGQERRGRARWPRAAARRNTVDCRGDHAEQGAPSVAQAPWPACPVQREQDSARLGYQGRRRICDRSAISCRRTRLRRDLCLVRRQRVDICGHPRVAARASGKLFRVGLTPSQVLDYLTYWNTLNTPPLPEERIKLAVKNIWKLEARRFGS